MQAGGTVIKSVATHGLRTSHSVDEFIKHGYTHIISQGNCFAGDTCIPRNASTIFI